MQRDDAEEAIMKIKNVCLEFIFFNKWGIGRDKRDI